MSDGIPIATIACEPCRRKKCKCDRKLPHCLQCKASPGDCQYPEKHKRGIPTGYVANLERRLAETERALFLALREIHEGTPMQDDYDRVQPYRDQLLSVHSDLTTPTTQQEKSALVRSWEKYPLGSRAETEAWFRSRLVDAHETSTSPQATLSNDSPAGATAPPVAPTSARSISTFRTVTQPLPTLIAREPAQRHPEEAIDGAVQAEIARINRYSQAKRLAEADRALYF